MSEVNKEDLEKAIWYMKVKPKPEKEETQKNIILDDGTMKCGDCDLFITVKYFTRHQDSMHSGVLYDCNMCNYQAKQRNSVKYHKKQKHNIDHECDFCKKEFELKADLDKHLDVDHQGENKFSCSECEFKSNHDRHMVRHHSLKHEGKTMRNGNYVCADCNTEFKQYRHMLEHKKTKHDGVKYPCDQCDYQAPWPSQVKTHKMTVHEGFKFECEQCDWTSNNKSSVSNHILTKHKNKRPKCPECSVELTSRGGLKVHILAKHTLVQPKKKCELCDFQYVFARKLAIHNLKVHNIGKWNVCEECGYRNINIATIKNTKYWFTKNSV